MKVGFHEAMAAALLLLAPVAGKGVDVSFAYQGLLLDEKGYLLSTLKHSIVFRIYDQATGGSPLWSCTRDVLLDEKGQFSVELSGSSNHGAGLCEMFAANAQKTLYIGLTVDDDAGEISPRQKLMSVPKAVWAADSVAAKEDMAVANALYGDAASLRNTSANALVVANKLECGMLQVSPMSVTNGNLWVDGPISGRGTIPVGGIVIWSGQIDTIPAGWQLCNGANGTPDLRDRFIVGAGKLDDKGALYHSGKTGGEAKHRLTTEEMPIHSHSNVYSAASLVLSGPVGNNTFFYSSDTSFDHVTANTHSGSTSFGGNSASGEAAAHENRPPFYALCYIMRVK